MFHAVGFQADGNVGIAVVEVHRIDDVGVGLTHPVHDDAEQLATLHFHVAVEHHQGEEVVGRGAHVGVEDDADVFLLVVALHVDALGQVIHGMLLVLPGESQRCGQAVFREDDGAVEIIFVFQGVVPAAHDVVVGMGVLDDGRQALLVEAVLGGDIRHGQALGGLAERIEAEREAFGVHLAHRPDDAYKFFVGNPLLGLSCEGDHQQQCEKECSFFHIGQKFVP